MRHRWGAVLVVTASMVAGPPAMASLETASPAAAPSNDHYADAMVVEGLPFSDVRDMSAATSEPLETTPSCATNPALPVPMAAGPALGADMGSVWYRFEPSTDGTLTLDPTASDFTVFASVYVGDDMVTHREVGCASSKVDAGVLTTDLEAGRSYAIQLVRIYGDEGTTLSLTIDGGAVTVLPPDPVFRPDASDDPATGDATVVAIIDTGISPYHWDFLASRMPQALDTNPHNDLPLDQPPHTWLPGFPDPADAFASMHALELTLEEDDPSATYAELRRADAAQWEAVTPSAPGQVHYHWVPGTKLIGAVTFSPEGRIEPPRDIRHGHPVASAAVGNYLGTCAECLLVFVQILPAETAEQRNEQMVAAYEWTLSQPWIDVVSSSQVMVLHTPPPPVEGILPRDATYANYLFDSAADPAVQRGAAQRGQTLFRASGNGAVYGVAGLNFIVPNLTVLNADKGPDWLVRVGGVNDTGEHLSGAGKPVDVAGVARRYPASDADAGVGEARLWDGTSFASPAVAGVYGHALHHARRSLAGASRAQDDGVIARASQGAPGFQCASVRSDCELGDGVLTANELRTRLLHGVLPTENGTTRTPLGVGPGRVDDPAPIVDEWTLANQGHGSYFGRAQPDVDWLVEADRVLAPMEGRAETLDRPEGEREWMIVDSFCRQEIWGPWEGGYYVEGRTALPGPDASWPIRSSIEASCPHLPLPLPDPSREATAGLD